MNIAKKSGSSSSEHIHDTTHTHLENPLHDRIQFKFDAVFPRSSTGKKAKASSASEMDLGTDIDEIPEVKSIPTETSSAAELNDISLSGLELNLDSTGSTQTEQLQSNSQESDSNEDFSLDLGSENTDNHTDESKSAPVSANEDTSVLNTTATGIDFSNDDISFDLGDSSAPSKNEVTHKAEEKKNAEVSFGSDDDISFDLSGDESISTPSSIEPKGPQQKNQEDDGLDFSFDAEEKPEETSANVNLMSTSEDMDNIGVALENIVTPSGTDQASSEDTFENFMNPVPDKSRNENDDFDFESVEFADKEEDINHSEMKDVTPPENLNPNIEEDLDNEVPPPAPVTVSRPASSAIQERVGFISEEDSTRVHATIRQLREEREELLNQIKQLRGHSKEVEQDNLTLKAALDEAKIENSIIKKRHMVEIEDIKYRMAISDEKRSIAEEKAKNAESNRMKLEQKVRIDFNQVKQREKELETKLEMLTLDIDSQVQTRDQKILELRRKIDSLEFNMENVSIREQKSQEDKRKLEDKLSKIMKTLRHSIKNLEDDIDQMTENEDEIKIKE